MPDEPTHQHSGKRRRRSSSSHSTQHSASGTPDLTLTLCCWQCGHVYSSPWRGSRCVRCGRGPKTLKIPRLRARFNHIFSRFSRGEETEAQRSAARRRRRWLRRNTLNLVFAAGLIGAVLLTFYIMGSMK